VCIVGAKSSLVCGKVVERNVVSVAYSSALRRIFGITDVVAKNVNKVELES